MKKTVVKTYQDFLEAGKDIISTGNVGTWSLAPDFNMNIMSNAMRGNDEFKVWGALVQNTWKSMSAKEQKNFINY